MSILGTALAGLGISLGSKLISPVINGLGNLISGGTWRQSGSEVASQEYVSAENQKNRDENRYLQENQYTMAINDLEKNGLNPNMIFGAGGVPSATGTSNSAAAGSGRRADIQGSMNALAEMSGLINSVTNARALDHQINKKSSNVTTQRIYDSVGNLMSTLVKTVK